LELKDLAFLSISSRFPLQSFVPNTSTKGFSLQPGLKGKILDFLPLSKKENNNDLKKKTTMIDSIFQNLKSFIISLSFATKLEIVNLKSKIFI